MLRRLATHPLTPLFAYSLAVSAMFAAYMIQGVSPSPKFETLVGFVWLVLLACWMVADARRRRCVPCFDFGFYCYFLLPVTLPWHCLRTRGWRGWLMLALLGGLYLGPYILSIAIWLVLFWRP